MKTKHLKVITSVLAFAIIFIVFSSCQKDASNNQKIASDIQKLESADPTPEGIIATTDAAIPPYNLNVILRGSSNDVGFVKFRQNPDTARIINLDTWLFNLKPNHAYLLQRAVDSIQHRNCFSTAWLTIGKGLVPQAIHTNSRGYGMERLFRDITALSRGTEFYIHFQVIDSITSEVVLTSNCFTYTVR